MNTLNIVNGGILSFPKHHVSSLSELRAGLRTAADNLNVTMGHNINVVNVEDIDFEVQDTMHTDTHYNFLVSLEFNIEADIDSTMSAEEATSELDWYISGVGGDFNVKHSEISDIR